MKNTFVLAFGLCLLFISGHAQEHNLPGYIVRVSGDTVRGLLQEQSSDESARSVLFKQVSETIYHTFTPAEIAVYQYDGGDLFRALTFSDTRMEKPVTRTCFARQLVAGECDLYSLTDKDVLLFLAHKDSSFYLIFDDDLHTPPGVQGNFRNELNFFSLSCEAARRDVDRTTYSPGSMTAFFQKVNYCLNPGKTTTSYYHRPSAKVGGYAYAGGLPLFSISQFTAEAGLRLTWPKVSPNASFNLGLRYISFAKRVSNPNYQFGGVTYPEHYKITSVPAVFQYNITRGIVQPYVLAGFTYVMTNVTSVVSAAYRDPDHTNQIDLVFGGGVDVRLVKYLYARADWRYEYVIQSATLGLVVRMP